MRLTDKYKQYFEQSDRFFMRHYKLYFRTREGIDFGPFDSKTEALTFLEAFLENKIFVRDMLMRLDALEANVAAHRADFLATS